MKGDKKEMFIKRKIKSKPVKSNCELCGKEKEYPYPSWVKRFCSHKCSNQWKWDNLREKGKNINCFFCGKEHWRRKGEIENVNKVKEGWFCSKQCFYKSRKGNRMYWLEEFYLKKGNIPWNKGMEMSEEFKLRCVERAKEQWTDIKFREKQMKRDFTKFIEGGNKFREDYKKKHGKYPTIKNGGGKAVQKKYLQKLGIKIK